MFFSLKPELFFHMKQNPDFFLHEKSVILQKDRAENCRVNFHTKILHLSRSGQDILFYKSEMDARLVRYVLGKSKKTNLT